MTHPTKAIMSTLLRDFIKQSAGSADEALYSEADLEAALERAEVLDFDQTLDLGGGMTVRERWGVGKGGGGWGGGGGGSLGGVYWEGRLTEMRRGLLCVRVDQREWGLCSV
jgi:hypothetical protein